jgi:Leucine-rich repeat (LRR) protein
MRLNRLLCTGLVLGLAALVVGCPRPVFFQDKALESAIRAEIGKPFGLLTDADLLGLRELDARGLGIRDLSGIEFCMNLAWLDLDTNEISDLNSLEQLGRPESPFDSPLVYLNLDNNEVTDITPLAGLLNLRAVSLFANQVANIDALVTNAQAGGLGPGDSVILDSRTLSDKALNVDVPMLTSYGVEVSLVVQSSGTGTGSQR